MLDSESASGIKDHIFFTSSNRGHSPDEMATMSMNKSILGSADAAPVIRDQALAHRDKLSEILVFYMTKMAQSERTTIWAKLRQQGHEDMAEIIRRL